MLIGADGAAGPQISNFIPLSIPVQEGRGPVAKTEGRSGELHRLGTPIQLKTTCLCEDNDRSDKTPLRSTCISENIGRI